MKLHNLVLTAALFLTAGAAFAAKSIDVPEFQNTTREENSSSINLTVFAMDQGWDYALVGYNTSNVKTQETQLLQNSDVEIAEGDTEKVKGTFITNKDGMGKLISTQLSDLPKNVKDGLRGHALVVYQFSVPLNDASEILGLKGGSGVGNTAYSLNTANNDNKFWLLADTETNGQIVFFGKSNFLKNLNNGAVILVGGKELNPVGSPLPAPVVTLLIALAFGAAFVMYRNRRMQVKA